MEILSAIDLAIELHGHTQNGFIIFDVTQKNASAQWRDSFPSLGNDQLARLGQTFTVRYPSMRDAQDAFTQICSDLADTEDTGVRGLITYVGDDWGRSRYDDCPDTRTLEFDVAEDDSRPVFKNRELTFVDIPGRS